MVCFCVQCSNYQRFKLQFSIEEYLFDKLYFDRFEVCQKINESKSACWYVDCLYLNLTYL